MFHKKKNRQGKYNYLVLGRDTSYFVKTNHSDSPKKFSELDIIHMLEVLLNNIFIIFGERVFQRTFGIPMGSECVPLLANLLHYSYEEVFILGILRLNEKKLARSFDFTFAI